MAKLFSEDKKLTKSMRLSEQTDVALRILMYLEVNSPNYSRIDGISSGCGASRAQVVKATQILRGADLIRSQIGRGGGFKLNVPAGEISVGKVIRLVETRLQLAECMQEERATKCPIVTVCRLRCLLASALDEMLAKLDSYSLRDMTENREQLMKLCAS